MLQHFCQIFTPNLFIQDFVTKIHYSGKFKKLPFRHLLPKTLLSRNGTHWTFLTLSWFTRDSLGDHTRFALIPGLSGFSNLLGHFGIATGWDHTRGQDNTGASVGWDLARDHSGSFAVAGGTREPQKSGRTEKKSKGTNSSGIGTGSIPKGRD